MLGHKRWKRTWMAERKRLFEMKVWLVQRKVVWLVQKRKLGQEVYVSGWSGRGQSGEGKISWTKVKLLDWSRGRRRSGWAMRRCWSRERKRFGCSREGRPTEEMSCSSSGSRSRGRRPCWSRGRKRSGTAMGGVWSRGRRFGWSRSDGS